LIGLRPRLLRRNLIRAFGLWTATAVVALFVLGPILWMVDSSLQGENELLSRPGHVLPVNPTLDNYGYIFTGEIPRSFAVRGAIRSRISQEAREIPQALLNSVIVALGVTLINLVLGALAAYSFARIRFRAKRLTFNFLLGSRLLPAMAIAIPFYTIINTLGQLDTYTALIVVYLTFTLPFTIWFLREYFLLLPKDMEDAALIDGCNRLQTLVRIVLPLAAPALVAAGAFAFMASYNEFLFALLLTQTINSQTLPVIIASVAVNPDASFALISVSVVLAMIPPLLFAVGIRRYLTRGLVGAVGHA
jgi:multiple sugar transport system permease protein